MPTKGRATAWSCLQGRKGWQRSRRFVGIVLIELNGGGDERYVTGSPLFLESSPSYFELGSKPLPFVKPVLSPSISLRINSVEGGNGEGFTLDYFDMKMRM